MEKIIVAFEKEKNALYMREMIESSGLASVQLCHSGMEVRRLAGQGSFCAVVCGYKLADGSAEALFEDLPPEVLMLMIATQPQLDLCATEGIFKLAAPVHREELFGSIQMLVQLNQHLEELEGEPDRETQQAKAVLMVRRGMSEEEAHRFLQKKSMDMGCKRSEVAKLVLEGRI